MTDQLRGASQPERDHLSPSDLLSDDPDKTVDPRAIRVRTQSDLGPGTCADIRDDLRNTDRTVDDVVCAYSDDYGKQTLQRHYHGRCAHDIDTPPVRYDRSSQVWMTAPHPDNNE